ncbi:hypothetical protein HYDPIDRAFT_35959 [Hydnomerulius pinastri MD-312]|nr:hypothetical protein HYDPIDRAFT_35959 [Hydnomerulius pinastri MD-312]
MVSAYSCLLDTSPRNYDTGCTRARDLCFQSTMDPFTAKAKAPPPSSGGKSAKKKKWSKGKVKDKAQHAVVCDKPTFDRVMKEVPTWRFISQSILIERLKVNGSLARVAIRHLEKEGLIKRIVHHSGQLIYTRLTTASD